MTPRQMNWAPIAILVTVLLASLAGLAKAFQYVGRADATLVTVQETLAEIKADVREDKGVLKDHEGRISRIEGAEEGSRRARRDSIHRPTE